MPSRNPHPPICLTARLDLRDYSGDLVLTLHSGAGDIDITLPVYDTDAGEGFFNCPLVWLNARGSNPGPGVDARDLGGILTHLWTGTPGNVVTVTIDEDDKVTIHSSLDDFTLDAGTANTALGFAAGGGLGAGVDPDGGFRLTASSDWVRGIVTGSLSITPAASAAVTVEAVQVQSVPTWLRTYDQTDDDGVADVGMVFERLLNTLTLTTSWRVGIDATGHVYIAVDANEFAWNGVTWVDVDFRNRLGFSGNETVTTSGNVSVLTAEHVMPGVHVVPVGLEYLNPGVTEHGEALPLVSGAWASNRVGSHRRWNLGFRLTGPADDVDAHQHWLNEFTRHAWAGAPVTLYQHWGDPRRALMSHEVNAETPAYSTLYTSERNGYQGRIDTFRSGSDAKDGVIQWGGRLRMRALVTMSLSGER